MRLILINPKRIGGYIIQPPLGLGYLASIAQKYCSFVDIWDMGIDKFVRSPVLQLTQFVNSWDLHLLIEITINNMLFHQKR